MKEIASEFSSYMSFIENSKLSKNTFEQGWLSNLEQALIDDSNISDQTQDGMYKEKNLIYSVKQQLKHETHYNLNVRSFEDRLQSTLFNRNNLVNGKTSNSISSMLSVNLQIETDQKNMAGLFTVGQELKSHMDKMERRAISYKVQLRLDHFDEFNVTLICRNKDRVLFIRDYRHPGTNRILRLIDELSTCLKKENIDVSRIVVNGQPIKHRG